MICCKSSRFHVFPMENDPFVFSRALCIRTRPDFRTATRITRCFLLSGAELTEGGSEGDEASSMTRQCVM